MDLNTVKCRSQRSTGGQCGFRLFLTLRVHSRYLVSLIQWKHPRLVFLEGVYGMSEDAEDAALQYTSSSSRDTPAPLLGTLVFVSLSLYPIRLLSHRGEAL